MDERIAELNRTAGETLAAMEAAGPMLREVVPDDGEWWDVVIRTRRKGATLEVASLHAEKRDPA